MVSLIERILLDALIGALALAGLWYIVRPLGHILVAYGQRLGQANEQRQLDLEHQRAIAPERQAAEKAQLQAVADMPESERVQLARDGNRLLNIKRLLEAWARQRRIAGFDTLAKTTFSDFVETLNRDVPR
jgi:hypothetical protein